MSGWPGLASKMQKKTKTVEYLWMSIGNSHFKNMELQFDSFE
jgi:hypothetical protein